MIEKPKIGEACNGCGVCCKIQVCMNGAFVQGLVRKLGETVKGPCPALVAKMDGTFSCGIIENPNRFIKGSKYPAAVLSKHFAFVIGAGTGCDELGEEQNEAEEMKLDKMIEQTKNDPEWRRRAQLAIKVIHGL